MTITKRLLTLCTALAAALLPCYAASPASAGDYISMAARADSLMVAADWEEAASQLTATLRAYPANSSNAMLFSNLGVCNRNLRRFPEALECFQIALVKAPSSTVVLTNRAKTYLLMDEKALALDDLETALKADSTLAEARTMRAMLRLEKGDIRGADDDFRHLLEQSAKNAGAPHADRDPSATYLEECHGIILAGAARTARLQGDSDRAAALYMETLRNQPDADTAVEALLYFLDTDKDLSETQKLIVEQARRHSRDGRIYLCMAALCKKRYQTSEMEANKKIAKEYGIDSQTIDNFLKNY